jgi:hypothetical protein
MGRTIRKRKRYHPQRLPPLLRRPGRSRLCRLGPPAPARLPFVPNLKRRNTDDMRPGSQFPNQDFLIWTHQFHEGCQLPSILGEWWTKKGDRLGGGCRRNYGMSNPHPSGIKLIYRLKWVSYSRPDSHDKQRPNISSVESDSISPCRTSIPSV